MPFKNNLGAARRCASRRCNAAFHAATSLDDVYDLFEGHHLEIHAYREITARYFIQHPERAP